MERDFPIGHPAASDYNGEPYSPPRAPFSEDFPEGHPARNGGNVRTTDTPDGFRAAQLQERNNLEELAAVGSLPPVIDSAKLQPVQLAPEHLAHVYALRNHLFADAEMADAAEVAIQFIVDQGHTPERAAEILHDYCTPVSQK